jgi:hypothetical protein
VTSVIIDRIVEEEAPHRGQIVGSDIPVGDLPIRRTVDVGLGSTRALKLEGAGWYHFFNWIYPAKQDLIHFEIGTDVFRAGMAGDPFTLFFTIGWAVQVFLLHTDVVVEIESIIGEHFPEGRGLTKGNFLIF